MIEKLRIKNFKSVKHVELECKKVNVFIGEPNSGKSNIIEAMSLLSPGILDQAISKDVLRFKTMSDLFYDSNINKPIEVFTEKLNYWLRFAMRENNAPENQFEFEIRDPSKKPDAQTVKIDHLGKIVGGHIPLSTSFRYYQYKRLDAFLPGYANYLLTPYGVNLPTLLLGNEGYRTWVEDFFTEKGFILTMKPAELDISISKLVKNSIYSYPYLTVSETLQRIVFYILAIKSNKDAILLLDEPESNTFPFYTKFLGERIGLDESNQFFITTHNPYLLLNLLEKTPSKDIKVFISQMKDYETIVTPLDDSQVKEVLDFNSDVFFNLDRILD